MKLTMLILSLVAFASVRVNAQTYDASNVKILRTPDSGIIKMIYAVETDEPVTVKFYNQSGEVGSDKIKGGPYPTGLLKRYDVRRIFNKDFTMEISTSKMTVVYRIIPSKDQKSFKPVLEKAFYNTDIVAAR
jgi:hypothetical protein